MTTPEIRGKGDYLVSDITRYRYQTRYYRGGHGHRAAAQAAGPGPGRHRDGPAHGRARRNHRERSTAPYPGRAWLLRLEPGMGRERVHARVRRAAAARRTVRRPTGAPPDLYRRHPGLRSGVTGRRVRH